MALQLQAHRNPLESITQVGKNLIGESQLGQPQNLNKDGYLYWSGTSFFDCGCLAERCPNAAKIISLLHLVMEYSWIGIR